MEEKRGEIEGRVEETLREGKKPSGKSTKDLKSWKIKQANTWYESL